MSSPGVYARARRPYKPTKVQILFVAESPPSSGGYFYFDKTIGKDHLFRETMKALGLWPLNEPMKSGIDKRPFLSKFCSRGFFLIDTCPIPVNKLSPRRRKEAILRGARGITSRVKRIKPKHILVVKKTVYHPIRDALVRDGLASKLLNKTPLYFPSHGNQAKFRKRVRCLISRSCLMSQGG